MQIEGETTGAPVPETTTTPAETSGSEELSPAERAYFESGGEASLTGEPEAAPAADAKPAPTADGKTAEPSPDDPEGTVELDDTGRVRDKRSGRFVPHGAFHKEREARKAAETSERQLRDTVARANERLAILSQAFGPAGPDPATAAPAADTKPPPDPETDIFGYAKYIGEQLTALQKRYDAEIGQTKARIDETETATAYRNDAMAFARERPDFGAAYTHLVKTLDAELEFRGVADPRERLRQIAALERDEVATARKAGKRPAEWMYRLAAMRGWQPKAGGGAAAPTLTTPSEPNAATSDAADRLATIERGQNAAKSLSSAGGGAPRQLTLEALANMSEDEALAMVQRDGGSVDKAFRRLFNNL